MVSKLPLQLATVHVSLKIKYDEHDNTNFHICGVRNEYIHMLRNKH